MAGRHMAFVAWAVVGAAIGAVAGRGWMTVWLVGAPAASYMVARLMDAARRH